MEFVKHVTIILLATISLTGQSQDIMFDIQGHRGARGVLPENSIQGFIYAIEAGVTTLELDVVISKDKKVVVSHEPWMSSSICLHPDGTAVEESQEKKLNIYKLNYAEIKKFDCGNKGNERFPEQRKISTYKPLLSEVISTVEAYLNSSSKRKVLYNIEIKSVEGQDKKFHPKPNEFAQLVYDELTTGNVLDRAVIQSFDVRSLQEVKNIDPDLPLALLIGQEKDLEENLEKLGFIPKIYSPNFKLINQETVDLAHKKGMKIIPWTVNDTSDMKRLIDLGVDGIITDFPIKLVQIVQDTEK